jgi:hypothetical protein
MNERLSTENASLLAELAKFHAGKHPLQRKLQTSSAAGSQAVTTGSTTTSQLPQTAGTAIPASISTPAVLSQQDLIASNRSSVAVKEALAAAVREVLLCSRQELLPSLMTAEGWEGRGNDGGSGAEGGGGSYWSNSGSSHLGGKAETAVSAAESSLRMRSDLMELQVRILRGQGATAGGIFNPRPPLSCRTRSLCLHMHCKSVPLEQFSKR